MESEQADCGWRIRTRELHTWEKMHRKLPRTGALKTLGLTGFYGLVLLYYLGLAAAAFMVQMLAFVTVFDQNRQSEAPQDGLVAITIITAGLILMAISFFGFRFWRGLRARILDIDMMTTFSASVLALVLFLLLAYSRFG